MASTGREILASIAAQQTETKGPTPSFNIQHLIYAILILGSKDSVGRKRLAELLGLGEGSVRTVLQKLRRAGLVVTSRGGCRLTDQGRSLFTTVSSSIPVLAQLDLKIPWKSLYNVGVVIRGAAGRVGSGLEQRDTAVRSGAESALVLVSKDGRLIMPQVSDLSAEQPSFAASLQDALRPRDGDVLIITGARDPYAARYAALAAAYTILWASE